MAALAISDPATSVRADVGSLRQAFESHPIAPTGMVYDVTNGTLNTIV